MKKRLVIPLMLGGLLTFAACGDEPVAPPTADDQLSLHQVGDQHLAGQFVARSDGSQEVPPSGSPGTGQGCLTLNPNPSGTLSFEISFSGLLSPEVAAHIHGPAAAGSNAGVLFPLPLGSLKIGAT